MQPSISLFRLVAFVLFAAATTACAGGIDCADLPEWSERVDGYELNLHHVFCGEPGNNGRAKGFHATPFGVPPSSFVGSDGPGKPDAAGVFTLRNVRLRFDGRDYVKSFSSMFPEACSPSQIRMSIVYSRLHSDGNCAAPGWAQCGPSGPANGGAAYCMGGDGGAFPIASALLSGTSRINTGFPIYRGP